MPDEAAIRRHPNGIFRRFISAFSGGREASQGYLGTGAFTHGQVYVGLSRCTTLGGIILKRPVIASDIIFDERVHEFRNRFNIKTVTYG